MTVNSPTTLAAEDKAARKHLDEILAFLKEKRKNSPLGTGLKSYEPRPSDVIVTTFPKAGTTLGQQLVYQTIVAIGGGPTEDIDGSTFEDIGQVSPWLDYIPQMTFKYLESTPRSFKTHAPASSFNVDEQKHVVIIRDPLKFAASWLNFTFQNYLFDIVHSASDETKQLWFDYTIEGEILGTLGQSSLGDCGGFGGNDDAVTDDERKVGPWCMHAKSWLDLLDHKNVVVMFYEDVVKNKGKAVDVMVDFLGGKQLTEQGRNQVIQRCSKEHMSESSQFDAKIDAPLFGTQNLDAKRVRLDSVNVVEKCITKDSYKKELSLQMQHVFQVDSYSNLKASVKAKQHELGLSVL